jgi:hypothetical protein
MKGLWRKAFLAAGFCLIAVPIVILLTMSHWWRAYREAVVTSDGEVMADATVYRSRDNQFVLLFLKTRKELYLIDLPARRILIPNRSSFIILPGCAFSRNVPPVGASMEKAEVESRLMINAESIEFSSVSNSRIRLGLRNL